MINLFRIISGVVILLFLAFLSIIVLVPTDILCAEKIYSIFGFAEMKDFYTFGITLFGVIGVGCGIFQTHKRISQQEIQLRDNNFVKGIELLGHENESTRIGGIYHLYYLAKEYPNEYKKSVFNILCSHIRAITINNNYQKQYTDKPSNEIQTLINSMFKKENNVFLFSEHKADLHQSWLKGADFQNAFLKGANFSDAHLEEAKFIASDLEDDVVFKNAHLNGTWFSNAHWKNTNIEYVDFKGAIVTKSINEAQNVKKALNINIREERSVVLPV